MNGDLLFDIDINYPEDYKMCKALYDYYLKKNGYEK